MLSRIAPMKAAVQVELQSPAKYGAAILSIMALITIRKRPKVTIVKGKVRTLSTRPERGVHEADNQ